MAKKREGWQVGQGEYSKVSDGKDKIVQGNRGDLPVGVGVRQLDINVIDDHSSIGMGSETGGAARKLPRKA